MEMNIFVECPVEEVFKAISDARTQPQWDPNLLEGRHIPDSPIQLGTKVIEVRKFLGKVSENEGEIIEFEANKRYVRKGGDDGISLIGTIELQPSQKGTMVSWNWDIKLSGFGSVFKPVMEIIFRREANMLLSNLKKILENGKFMPYTETM